MHEKQYNGGSTRDPAAKCRETQSRTAGVLANFFALQAPPGLPSVANTAWKKLCSPAKSSKPFLVPKTWSKTVGLPNM